MIHVCGAWILPAIAFLSKIIDKFCIIHFFPTHHKGFTDRFHSAGVEILNNRRVLIVVSTYYGTIPLYIIVCRCI